MRIEFDLRLCLVAAVVGCGSATQAGAGVTRGGVGSDHAASPASSGADTAHATEAAHPGTARVEVWNADAGRWIGAAELRQRLLRQRFILLGERHDNPDHHAGQAQVLTWLAEAGKRPAVVLEMLDRSQQPSLDAIQRAGPAHSRREARARADALAARVSWADSGWPDWAMYRPIFVTALLHGLPLVAGNLTSEEVHAVMRDGIGVLDPALVKSQGLDVPLPEAQQQALLDELATSHCDMLPDEMLPAMARVQRARDAFMAERLEATATADGAVLVAGAGHVRRDRGVPWYLRRTGARALAIGFTEADPPGSDATASTGDRARTEDAPAMERGRAGKAAAPAAHPSLPKEAAQAYDLVWLTPKLPRTGPDPCDALRERFR